MKLLEASLCIKIKESCCVHVLCVLVQGQNIRLKMGPIRCKENKQPGERSVLELSADYRRESDTFLLPLTF